MSETTTTTPETETEPTNPNPDNELAPMFNTVVERAIAAANQANEYARQLKNVESPEKLAHDLILTAETDDPEVLRYRTWLEDQESKLEAAYQKMTNYLKENNKLDTSDIDVDATKLNLKNAKDEVKNVSTVLSTLISDEAELNFYLAKIPAVVATRTNNTNSSTGVKRYRWNSIKVDGVEYSTLSEVAKALETSVTDITKQLVSAVGTEDLRSVEKIDVSISANEKNYSFLGFPNTK